MNDLGFQSYVVKMGDTNNMNDVKTTNYYLEFYDTALIIDMTLSKNMKR